VRSSTQTISLPVDQLQAFAFLAEPQNLPRWAVGFCHAIRPTDEATTWIATTGQGEVRVRYVADPKTGVIDFHLSPAPGVDVLAASRVVPNGDHAEYVFTQFQSPGMPDEVFAAQVAALGDELQVLARILSARLACRAS
jgi:hypothetical protein